MFARSALNRADGFLQNYSLVLMDMDLCTFCLLSEARRSVSQRASGVPAAWRFAYKHLLAEQDESSCFSCNHQPNLIFEAVYFALEALTRDCVSPWSSLIQSVIYFPHYNSVTRGGNLLLFVFSSDSSLPLNLQPSSKTIYYYYYYYSFFLAEL